jgi:hypothetical protein
MSMNEHAGNSQNKCEHTQNATVTMAKKTDAAIRKRRSIAAV